MLEIKPRGGVLNMRYGDIEVGTDTIEKAKKPLVSEKSQSV